MEELRDAWDRIVHAPWRAKRTPAERTAAQAAVAAAIAGYAAWFILAYPYAGASAAALFVVPCVVGGWAFGALGGFVATLLMVPLQGILFGAGLGVAVPVTDTFSRVLGIVSSLVVGLAVGLMRDLSEEVRDRSGRLAESEDRYRRLVEASPDGVLVHAQGVIVFANPSIARLLGRSDPLVGRTLVTLVPFEDRDAFARNFVFAPRAKLPHTVEARFAADDGSLVTAEVTGVPVVYQGAPATLALIRDSEWRAKRPAPRAATLAAPRPDAR